MAAVLAAASYSRIGFSLCLAVRARCVRFTVGSAFHLEPETILMTLKMGVVYNHITESYVERKRYGYLTLVAIYFKGQIGALNAEIYSKRVSLMGKLVLTGGNSLVGYEEK